MTVTLALAGDMMLGRGVAARIRRTGPLDLVAPEIRWITRAADLFVLNLECCVSARGSPWPDPTKPFFFRAPPTATETLSWLGVDCVTLANNHALDFRHTALLDTLTHLHDAGIATVGAGRDVEQARHPVVLTRSGLRVGVLGVTDHPADFAATPRHPGVAHAALQQGVPDWLVDRIDRLRRQTDLVLVTPHWGPEHGARTPRLRPTRRRGPRRRRCHRGGGGTRPTCSTVSPDSVAARSCSTWATSSTTTRSTRCCGTTAACCSC